MALRLDQIDDFVTLTLNEFQRLSWVDISLDLQAYVAMRGVGDYDPPALINGRPSQWISLPRRMRGGSRNGVYA